MLTCATRYYSADKNAPNLFSVDVASVVFSSTAGVGDAGAPKNPLRRSAGHPQADAEASSFVDVDDVARFSSFLEMQSSSPFGLSR